MYIHTYYVLTKSYIASSPLWLLRIFTSNLNSDTYVCVCVYIYIYIYIYGTDLLSATVTNHCTQHRV